MFDKNGDGVLTRDEFAELIGAVTGKQDDFLGKGRDERDILQMYTQAIDVRQLSFPSVCLAASPRRVFPWLYSCTAVSMGFSRAGEAPHSVRSRSLTNLLVRYICWGRRRG